MDTKYRQIFLKDLKKLKKLSAYKQIFHLAFTIIPESSSLRDISNVKPMKGSLHRYRIRVGDYRVGIEVKNNTVEMTRVLRRHEFYRYFP